MFKIIAVLNFRKILKSPGNFILFKLFGFSLLVFLLNPIVTWMINYESIPLMLFVFVIHVIYCIRESMSLPVNLRVLMAMVVSMANYNAIKFIALIIYMYISRANFAP